MGHYQGPIPIPTNFYLFSIDPTCTDTPINVYHGDLIYFKYSASPFGTEEKTLAVKRCHKGYWINKNVFESQTFCDAGNWKPELDACRGKNLTQFILDP